MTWKLAKFGDILTESKIESSKSEPDKRITVRLNCKGVEKRPFEPGVEGGTKYYVRKKGQFIYGKQNLFKGAFGLVPEELDGFESSQDIPTFDIDKNCLPEWLICFLRQGNFYKSLESIATGTGSRRIQPTRLYEVEFPLPNLNEQKKIIEYVHQVEHKYQMLDKELIQQQTYIQLLRQTILQEAVQGKLTKQDPTDEPATELLKRIKAEKEKFVKASKLKKEKELPPITEDEIPFELPEGWRWCRLGEVVLKSEAGKSLVCDPRPVEGDEWGVIKVSAMSWGKFNEKENKALPAGIKPIQEYKIFEGDYLISRANTSELIGKSVIVGELQSKLLLSDKSIRIKFSSFINIRFVNFYNNSSVAREYYKVVSSGTSDSMKNITREQMYMLHFPLPPLAEQQRIVAKVEQLQQQLSQLEAQVQQSHRYAQQLLKSVLKEAFEQKENVQDVLPIKLFADELPILKIERYIPNEELSIVAAPTVSYGTGNDELTSDEELQLLFIILNIASHQKDAKAGAYLGDVKMEKTCHLGESTIRQLHFNRNPTKEKFGPADFMRLYRLHDFAAANHIFFYDKNADYKKYSEGENFKSYLGTATKTFQPFAKDVEQIIKLLLPLKTRATDVLVTTFAAWNNLLIRNEPTSLQTIANEARWHEKKKTFKDDEIQGAINFLNYNKMQPKGKGKLVM